ncbi:MAG: hypothetical protein A3E85_00270 [Gammaproteobacteria bacterium RIFCSPHIGHO2_12_FULL_45_12]|nr:MAG: hypothetical protein A3E85_00270 [Gammaproteobacteria bacterium RIFCSPHIGHO2_12_FULL_45_12]
MTILSSPSQMPNPGLLKVSGPDAEKLLEGQITCHVAKITPQQGSLAAHCNPQGRIISLFYLFFLENNYYLLMPQNMLPAAMTALQKFAVFYKVTLSNASHEMACISYTDRTAIKRPMEKLATLRVAPHCARYLALGHPSLIETLHPDMDTLSAWNDRQLSDGIPSIYPETSEKFLPHELNLEHLGALSFEKGCFTGQEIIARMQYRGKLKKRLYQAWLTTNKPPQRGADIFNEDHQQMHVCGTLVDAACLHDSNYRLLIILNDAAASRPLFLDPEQQTTLIISGESP